VPEQVGNKDCGIFAIAYVKVFLSLSHPEREEEWKACKNKPKQSDIEQLRNDYFRLNLQINFAQHDYKKSIRTSRKEWEATMKYMQVRK
jgi:hypothetical protein